MDDPNRYFEESTNTLYANVMQKLMFIFLILFLIAVAQPINPKQEESHQGLVAPPGNIMVEIHWPDKIDVDVDLWVQSPGDEKPVGYSNKSGKVFNLLRDDLGKEGDETDLNYEVAYGRGLPAGEYTVNLHLFANREHLPEIPVDVVVSVQRRDETRMRQIIVRKVFLKKEGDEVTVVRFTLDHDGSLDPESVNDLFKELRTWSPTSPSLY